MRDTTLRNIRAHHQKHELYRTPAYSFTPLLNYRPDWFTGSMFDPCAGDGRMVAEVIRRGNTSHHHVGDIRAEERVALEALPNTTVRMGDYLAIDDLPEADCFITNPPISLSAEIVKRARTHIRGPICILQSVQWQSTQRRSMWLKRSDLAFVLNLSRRPKWQVDAGVVHSNIWDFAWYVFLPGYDGLPVMDWIDLPQPMAA
jgi:hypothetical protein